MSAIPLQRVKRGGLNELVLIIIHIIDFQIFSVFLHLFQIKIKFFFIFLS